VAEAERGAEIELEKATAHRAAAGMSPGRVVDWLEKDQRFILRFKGRKIQITPRTGVSLRELVAVKIHYAGILALLKNREDWGTIDALEG
jgi:hypothetical protein